MQAEWADEWRAELAAVITMPLTAARYACGLRYSARALTADPALQPAGGGPGVRPLRTWRCRPQLVALAAFRAARTPTARVLRRVADIAGMPRADVVAVVAFVAAVVAFVAAVVGGGVVDVGVGVVVAVVTAVVMAVVEMGARRR